MTTEEEGEPGGERVHIQASLDGCLNVGNAVGHGEGDLLDRGATGFPHVVTTDADGIPLRKVILTEAEDISYDSHGFPGRKDVGSPSHVFLEDLVLGSPPDGLRLYPLLFGHGDIHGQEDGRRCIDGHRSGDPVQGNTVKDGLHVRQGVDGYTNFSHLSRAQGMIGIVADLGWKVEGHAETRLAMIQEISVALVGLLRSGKAGVLPHGPEPAPIHGRLYSPCKGIFTRKAQLFGIIEPLQVQGGVDTVQFDF